MTMIREMLSARRAVLAAALGAGLLAAAGCSSDDSDDVKHQYPEQIGGSEQHDPLGHSTSSDEQVGSMLDKGGLLNFSHSKKDKKKKKKEKAKDGTGGLAVNRYLWRATLDTLSFMPMASADPIGGVIITDWYSDPKAPRERFKVTVYILDKTLRADGIKATVFRQVLTDENVWVDQPATKDTTIKIENAILTRARQLRVADMNED